MNRLSLYPFLYIHKFSLQYATAIPYMRYSISVQHLKYPTIETIVFILADWHTIDFSLETKRTLSIGHFVLEIRCTPQTRVAYQKISLFSNICIIVCIDLLIYFK